MIKSILTAAKIRQDWKLIHVRWSEQLQKRIIQVFPIASDHRVPDEILEESQISPGLFRQRETGERFVLKANRLIPC